MMEIGAVIGFLAGILLFVWIATRYRLTDWSADNEAGGPRLRPRPRRGQAKWEDLEEIAQRVVEEAQDELPPDVQDEALAVPTLLEEWHPDKRSILGIYCNFERGEAMGPIVLYLRAIEAWCLSNRESFEEEVRVTYLHELGHHFGWNEGQVEEHGLE